MLIIDYEPYIRGKRVLDAPKVSPYRGTKEDLQFGLDLLNVSQTATYNLKIIENAKLFWNNEPDLKEQVAACKREEIFYALKNNMITPVIPAKALFYIHKVYEKYPSLNLLPKALPASLLNSLITPGYIQEEYSLFDVIASIVNPNYIPIDSTRCVKNGDYFDIYIEDTDMIAIIPKDIKEKLREDDISRIKVKEGKGLMLGDLPLINLSGAPLKITDSVYDLRRII